MSHHRNGERRTAPYLDERLQPAPPIPAQRGSSPVRSSAGTPYNFVDDLMFALVDDRTGKLRADRTLCGFGLTAALLAELAAGGGLSFAHRHVYVAEHYVPPRDAVCHAVLDQIIAQRPALPIRDWLDFYAKTAVELVAGRMGRAGLLVREERRRALLPTVVLYRPTDNNLAAWPRARLAHLVRNRYEMTPADLVLVGLCHGIGVLRHILDGAGDAYEPLIGRVQECLSSRYPALLLLIDELEQATDAYTRQLA